MPMPAQKPATTPIPVQLSEAEFTGIYLTAPLHAQTWPQVQSRLSSRLQPHLAGPVYLWVPETRPR
jgi:hypothetical protein